MRIKGRFLRGQEITEGGGRKEMVLGRRGSKYIAYICTYIDIYICVCILYISYILYIYDIYVCVYIYIIYILYIYI
jgi:hypothetical protein